MLTDSDGCLRCHRADHGGKVSTTSKTGPGTGRQPAGTVWPRLGVPCGPDCIYPDEVEVRGKQDQGESSARHNDQIWRMTGPSRG